MNDDSERAYEELVDRLLKGSRYGERWARLWLNLARYADTAGYEGDPDLPHAWRYRDYVIDAFNDDKPYDLFIKEQIAGDNFNEVMGASDLPATSPERIVALTFLRLAPFTEPLLDTDTTESQTAFALVADAEPSVRLQLALSLGQSRDPALKVKIFIRTLTRTEQERCVTINSSELVRSISPQNAEMLD